MEELFLLKVKTTEQTAQNRFKTRLLFSSFVAAVSPQQTQTSLRRLKTSWKGHDILRPKQTSSRHLEKDVWFTTSWRCLIYVVLKTSNLRRLEDVWFMKSWRRLINHVMRKSNLRRLEVVCKTTFWGRLIYDVLKMSNLCCFEDVQFTTSSRRLIYDV